MRQVFTLWPMGNDAIEQRINAEGIPTWALTDDCAPLPGYRPWPLFAGTIVLIALIVAAALLPSSAASMSVAAAAVLTVLILGYSQLRAVSRLRLELDSAQRWNDTIFQRSGIALWREDWTFARDAVLRALRSGERDMQTYFAARPDELREIRSKVIIKDVNDAAVARAGAPNKAALLGPLDRILPDSDHTFMQWLVAFARGDTLYRSETHLTLPSGLTRDTLFSVSLPRDMRGFEDILVSDLDITEYKAAQARLAQAEMDIERATRITTMGALSASIAHEVNSPLAAIVASSEAALLWLRRDAPDIDEAIGAMLAINQQAVRAQNVVERTRAYLNNSPVAAGSYSVGALVSEATQLIQRELRDLKASIHVSVPEDLPYVLADPVNIQQVLVNLLLNAAQAMEGKNGPRDIAIHAHIDERMMNLSVSDSGPGIDPDQIHVIFKPFYSTRDGGMGMGLTICRTCIGAHGGQLWVTNRPGQGATFHFSLPLAQEN